MSENEKGCVMTPEDEKLISDYGDAYKAFNGGRNPPHTTFAQRTSLAGCCSGPCG